MLTNKNKLNNKINNKINNISKNKNKNKNRMDGPMCAGFVVICIDSNLDSNSESKIQEPHVLLVSTHKNVWGFPKGKREHEETHDVCAFRELNEETGLKPSDIQTVDMESFCLHEITDKGIPSVTLFVATTNRLIKPNVKDVDELQCAKWVKVSDAYSLLTLKNRKQILEQALLYLKTKIELTTIVEDNVMLNVDS